MLFSAERGGGREGGGEGGGRPVGEEIRDNICELINTRARLN